MKSAPLIVRYQALMARTGSQKERESRLAEVLGHFGEGDAVVPTSAQLASRL